MPTALIPYTIYAATILLLTIVAALSRFYPYCPICKRHHTRRVTHWRNRVLYWDRDDTRWRRSNNGR